jgi:hypothetical protein
VINKILMVILQTIASKVPKSSIKTFTKKKLYSLYPIMGVSWANFVCPEMYVPCQKSYQKGGMSLEKIFPKQLCFQSRLLVHFAILCFLISLCFLNKKWSFFVLLLLYTLCVLRINKKNPAIVLALYNRYLKLSSSWLLTHATSLEIINKSMVIHYDGPNNVCSEFGSKATPQSDHGNIWMHYLGSMSDRVLGN